MSHPDLRIAMRLRRPRFGPPIGTPRPSRPAGLLVTGMLLAGMLLAGMLLAGMLLAGCAAPYRSVDLRITHRIFPQFKEQHAAAPGERFQVGDTDYSARITGFVPDFVMDEQTGKVSSRSKQPRNPAFEIEVFQAGASVERAWAFLKGGPPHFGRHSMLNFEVERIDWKPGRGPVDSDSTAVPDSSGAHSQATP